MAMAGTVAKRGEAKPSQTELPTDTNWNEAVALWALGSALGWLAAFCLPDCLLAWDCDNNVDGNWKPSRLLFRSFVWSFARTMAAREFMQWKPLRFRYSRLKVDAWHEHKAGYARNGWWSWHRKIPKIYSSLTASLHELGKIFHWMFAVVNSFGDGGMRTWHGRVCHVSHAPISRL